MQNVCRGFMFMEKTQARARTHGATHERSVDVGIISSVLELIFNRGIFKPFTVQDEYHLSHHFLMFVSSRRPHGAHSDPSVKLTKCLTDCITKLPVAYNQSFLSPCKSSVCKIHDINDVQGPTCRFNSAAPCVPSVEHFGAKRQNAKCGKLQKKKKIYKPRRFS